MTLTKAIDAAREAYHRVKDVLSIADRLAEQDLTAYNNLAINTGDKTFLEMGRSRLLKVKNAFADLDTMRAALPDKAITEDEILAIMVIIRDKNGTLRDMIKELKAANVLYVEEK